MLCTISCPIRADDALDTALQDAINQTNPFDVQTLLEKGANVNVGVGSDQSLLMQVAAYNAMKPQTPAPPNYEGLLRHPFLKSSSPMPPTTAHLLIMEILINAGADIESRDDLGRTALWWAVCDGNNQSVELLLQHGANTEAVDELLGRTALMFAVMDLEEDGKSTLLLEHGAKVNASDRSGETVLMLAAGHPVSANVALLLKHGAEVNARSPHGSSALMEAARRGCTDNARLLLEHGGEVNAQAVDGITALMYAAGAGDHYIYKYDKKRRTYLQVYQKELVGTKDLVALLLSKGAKVNLRDRHHFTALHYANDPAIIRLLKQHGARE